MSDNWYSTDPDDMEILGTINDSDVGTAEVMEAARQQVPFTEIWNNPGVQLARKAMTAWLNNTNTSSRRVGRYGTAFTRDAYVTPRTKFSQFEVAERAFDEDDIVSGIYEITESLAFSKMAFQAEDEEQEDIWNQIYEKLDLDSRMREMWHDLFIFSQVYVGLFWGTDDFKVRGSTKKGNAKRKTFNQLRVPLGMTILDPRKVIPTGTFMFNKEQLVYIASNSESQLFDRILSGNVTDDPIVQQLILKEVSFEELGARSYLNDLGYAKSNIQKLYMLNPQNVFRHTLTRPQYKAVATVRMVSIFELLDLKQNLKEMDRAHLIGGTNAIVLIKQGTDAWPANKSEIQTLAGFVRTGAAVPVIVGDHRLTVEIITPKLDMTLDREKYDIIDSRISQRLLQMFINPGGRQEDSMKLGRMIARGIENRRHMLRQSLQRAIVKPTMSANAQFTSDPTLEFSPHHIALDFDMNFATFMQALRDRGDLSRETMLSEFDFDQVSEAWKREQEKANGYDKIFETTVPYTQANPQKLIQGPAGSEDPKTAGTTKGGNQNGGGSAKPATNRGKTKEQQ